jgi:hypothetical protein
MPLVPRASWPSGIPAPAGRKDKSVTPERANSTRPMTKEAARPQTLKHSRALPLAPSGRPDEDSRGAKSPTCPILQLVKFPFWAIVVSVALKTTPLRASAKELGCGNAIGKPKFNSWCIMCLCTLRLCQLIRRSRVKVGLASARILNTAVDFILIPDQTTAGYKMQF